jgi:hypothetical protein
MKTKTNKRPTHVGTKPEIQPILRKTLIRNFYFAEALAVYERFYSPLISSYAPARRELTDPGRKEDRPPTLVPLVFHCTTADRIQQIFADGALKPGKRGTVSFTEIPIGELDRMKYRHHGADQVAIGFPRRYVESLGLTPVWYLKHNSAISNVLASLKSCDQRGYAKLAPFVDEKGDVSPFQEVRTTSAVDINEAVWILTTKRNGGLHVPGIEQFEAKYGQISKSYWHRSHQLGILSEWQYTKLTRDKHGVPQKFAFIGEHYWRQRVTEQKELNVRLPLHNKELIFETTRSNEYASFRPSRFIDVARYIAKVLVNAGESLEDALPYRVITGIAQS